jgi:hypothetical protein
VQLVTAPSAAGLAEHRDAPPQHPLVRLLDRLHTQQPVRSFVPGAARRAPLTAGLGDVAQQQPTRPQCLVDPGEQPAETLAAGARVRGVVQALPDGGDRHARPQLGVQQRRADEPGPGRPLPGALDHVRGQLDPQHLVAGIGEDARGDAAARAQVDHQPGAEAGTSKQAQPRPSAAAGQVPERGVVHVGEVPPIEQAGHRLPPSWVSKGADARDWGQAPPRIGHPPDSASPAVTVRIT